MAAIQTASLLPKSIRANSFLGYIVLTADGRLVAPNQDSVFLGGNHASSATDLVHPQLETDTETLDALRKLGIRPASPETVLREVVSKLLQAPASSNGDRWVDFWRRARDVEQSAAAEIVREFDDWRSYPYDWRGYLQVRTVAGQWRTLYEALLPGPIVPDDGSRDGNVAIDVQFHGPDMGLLRELGAADKPIEDWPISHGHWTGKELEKYQKNCRDQFTQRDLPQTPHSYLLNFDRITTTEPLDVLESLSEEGRTLYTSHLLDLPATYEQWTMRHDTREIYPPMDFESPALAVLREHGRIRTVDGIRKLSDGLGDPPKDRAVLHELLRHPQADRIRQAFDLHAKADLLVDPVRGDSPIPLVDEWPGLKPRLSEQQADLQLVRCDGFRRFDGETDGDEPDCIERDGSIYVARRHDEEQEIRLVLQALRLRITNNGEIERILLGLTPEDVQEERDKVSRCSTDEERLLTAVSETELRRRLPQSLLAILEDTQGSLSGIEVAKAAISVFHTGALREYRDALARLDPPKQWAGRRPAVEFVRSLGFDEEWAGDPNTRREPFVEVDGPYSLPPLHGYQLEIVSNVKDLIRSNGALTGRRGMISMPTGSGKTRVAVQAIVEAIREDELKGGILWVADRDELCEQAVESWRQVWASEGTQATRLRISRMWAGQHPLLPTGDMHVIVATIQTLSAKMKSQASSYEFLADFKVLVFDEAHRSVAPIFTSVMEELGLTRWKRPHEPILIGLTATPFRGRDRQETERLVSRYGKNRLDEGAFASKDPEKVIEELQTKQVLARADHATIQGGNFLMSPDELRQSRQTPYWLPQSVEDRIARDADRTRRIIEAYRKRIDPDWPTLIFATSVEHSKTVAALLTRMGVKARVVSAETETSVRRRIVEEFREGEIKALVNYGIFREGFDAPKTRAIVVARPVYSPNLYFQMIGRGLRGVKNDGNERCLILDVRDNIQNFERRLAFSDLDWLWSTR